MKNLNIRLALLVSIVPLILLGCATQGAQGKASGEPQKPVAGTPLAFATASQLVTPHLAKPAQPLPPPSAIETQYGIQIMQVGLTASGGLVDVRFKVLDVMKVRALLGNPANTPMLIAADKPPLMAPHNALHGAKFGQGQIFYILYPNLRGTIRPGIEVTVALGDTILGPVTAQ